MRLWLSKGCCLEKRLLWTIRLALSRWLCWMMVQWKLYDRKQHHNTPSSIKGFRHVKVECVCQQNSQTSGLIIACAYTVRSVCGRQIRTFCQLLWTSERKADKVVFLGIEKRLLERGRGGALHKRREKVKPGENGQLLGACHQHQREGGPLKVELNHPLLWWWNCH